MNDKGEWRTVAFFNEKRELGDWYRTNFDEVKNDLAVFIFKGVCRGDHAPVQLTTKFPVRESLDAFNERKIGLDDVAVNVNAPARASFDSQTEAYTFDLPYLFLISQKENENLYSLEPPRLLGRDTYAKDVIDHWDCKSVTAENVTYQFLICRTTTLSRNPAERSFGHAAFGASAYFILSDGKEASSAVKLTFDDGNSLNLANEAPAPPPTEWETPDADERLVNIVRNEFRIRFNRETWTGRTSEAQVLSGQKWISLTSFMPAQGADYCVWLPGGASVFSGDAEYAVTWRDQDGTSSTSFHFDIAAAGQHAGTLQCFFPRVSSAASVPFGRWTSIAGSNLTLEIRP